MIVMKFGGTSVGEAERIVRVAGLVAARASSRPVIVVSALAGVTDGLLAAIEAARRGELELLEPCLADVERRNRWALSGAVTDANRRHDLRLEVDRLFEELRGRVRSIRVLGEATPRAVDEVLATGELLSSRIVAAAVEEAGLRAHWIDPRQLMITDETHGLAEPRLDAVRRNVADRLLPMCRSGEIPVTGGFVGATADGVTTTLGRGGSDTSAAVLGAALEADEIQIWTDVDGLMTADPRLVPQARTLERLSFAEAAELACHGAKVLHPASIAPAVERRIPVRVLNTLHPDGAGTVVLDRDDPPSSAPAAIASLRGRCVVRVGARRRRVDPHLADRVIAVAVGGGQEPELVVRVGVGAAVVLPGPTIEPARLSSMSELGQLELLEDRALVAVVGAGLAAHGACRRMVLDALAKHEPDLLALGGTAAAIACTVPECRLEATVRALHASFFEAGAGTEGSR